MNNYDIFNNDFVKIGTVQALSATAALEKAKTNPKIKKQCSTPMVEEAKAPIQDSRVRMYRH